MLGPRCFSMTSLLPQLQETKNKQDENDEQQPAKKYHRPCQSDGCESLLTYLETSELKSLGTIKGSTNEWSIGMQSASTAPPAGFDTDLVEIESRDDQQRLVAENKEITNRCKDLCVEIQRVQEDVALFRRSSHRSLFGFRKEMQTLSLEKMILLNECQRLEEKLDGLERNDDGDNVCVDEELRNEL